MDVNTRVGGDNQTLILDIGEKFDFSKVESFRAAYKDLPSGINHISVDLAKTEYMDSSALGMLLNMQKALTGKELTYSIVNARPAVARILQISRFDKKFTLR